MALTTVTIKALKPAAKPYKRTDGKGLVLFVQPSGAKLWRYRYELGGKEGLYALGEFVVPPASETPEDTAKRIKAGRLTLAEARDRRQELSDLVKRGISPLEDERARAVASQIIQNNTFRAIAEEWIAKHSPTWTAGYQSQVEEVLTRDVFPALGTRPIIAITAADILAVLQKIDQRGVHATANKVRAWIGAIFRYAVSTLRAPGDPSAALRGALVRHKTQHHRPLTRTQLGDLIRALENYGGARPTVIALHLLRLTAVRQVELRGATWSEFDLDAATWTIPPQRMKMGQEHRVPLARQAMALVRELHTYSGRGELLFSNTRSPGTCMSNTTLNRALERLGFNGGDIDISAHSFRSTFSTIANELGFRYDAIERQLAHADPDPVRRAYNHATYWDERVKLMQVWADLQDALARGATIIPIGAHRQAA
jgi:integrase